MSELFDLESVRSAGVVLKLLAVSAVLPILALGVSYLALRKYPRHRSTVSCITLMALIGFPAASLLTNMAGITWPGGSKVNVESAIASKSTPVVSGVRIGSGESIEVNRDLPVANTREPAFPPGSFAVTLLNVFAVIWLLGITLMVVRFLFVARRLSKLIATTRRPTQRELARLEKTGCLLGMRSNAEIRISPFQVIPFFSGLIRKRVVIPQSLFSELPDEELAMVIEHELAHCRQGDQRILALQQFAGIIYWWNPIVRVLINHLSQTREEMCDYAVSGSMSEDSVDRYSNLLISIASSMPDRLPMPCTSPVTSSFKKLRDRIRALQSRAQYRHSNPGRIKVGAMVLLVAGFLAPLSCSPYSNATEKKSDDKNASPVLKQLLESLLEEAVVPDGSATPAKPDFEEAKVQIKIDSKFVEVHSRLGDDLPSAMLLNREQFRELMRAFESTRDADILTAPKVTTLNQQECEIEVGSQVPLPGGKEGGIGKGEVRFVKTGINLAFKPTFSDGRIYLNGKAVIREIDGGAETPEEDGEDGKPEGAISFNTVETFFNSGGKPEETLVLFCRKSAKHKGHIFITLSPKLLVIKDDEKP